MTMRFATTDDIPELVRIINAAYRVEDFFIKGDRTSVEDIGARMAAPDVSFLVVEAGDSDALAAPFSEGVKESGFIELPIGFQHADAVEFLPPHHADPFDRMLLAQAKVERLVLVTHDRSFEPYGQPIVWT